MRRFSEMPDGRFPTPRRSEAWPCLQDAVGSVSVEPHYFYHPAWASRVLAAVAPARHVDVGSDLRWAAIASANHPIEYYEYRPPVVSGLSGFSTHHGDLLRLPFADGELASLSCMHTLEHVGLGRYGDPLDPTGDLKAAAELSRVTAAGADLLVVTPVGRSRIMFNANRVYGYEQVLSMFDAFDVHEFMLILEDGRLLYGEEAVAASPSQDGGCGCFWFKKRR